MLKLRCGASSSTMLPLAEFRVAVADEGHALFHQLVLAGKGGEGFPENAVLHVAHIFLLG